MTLKRKIMRIMDLVTEISPPDIKYNGEKKPVAFFNYSGHCACLSVQVYENGWKEGAESNYFDVYNIHNKMFEKQVNQELDEVIEYLEKLRRR